MILLRIDVVDRVFDLRDADTERSVGVLPGKTSSGRLVIDPFGRAAFGGENTMNEQADVPRC